jgi:hypothetical protein
LAKLKAPNSFYFFMIILFDKKALCAGNKENLTLLYTLQNTVLVSAKIDPFCLTSFSSKGLQVSSSIYTCLYVLSLFHMQALSNQIKVRNVISAHAFINIIWFVFLAAVFWVLHPCCLFSHIP